MSFLSIYTLFSDLQFILSKQWKIPYNFVLQKSPAVFSRNENAAESSQHTCPSGLMWDLTREVLSFVSLSQAYAPQSSMIPKSLPKWFNSEQCIISGFGQRQPPVQNVTISARSWLLGTLLNSLKKKKWSKYSCLQSSVSGAQQSAWFYIYPLCLGFFPHTGHYPVLYSRSLLVIYFIYSSVYLSIPVSQFSPLPDPRI